MRGDQTSVDKAWDGHVVGPWFMDTDGFLSILVTFNLQTRIVQATATIAAAEMVVVVVLEGLFRHVLSLCKLTNFRIQL